MKDKRYRYKTAYSPLYEQYVGIVDVWEYKEIGFIYRAYLSYSDKDECILFTEDELTNFCL